MNEYWIALFYGDVSWKIFVLLPQMYRCLIWQQVEKTTNFGQTMIEIQGSRMLHCTSDIVG